MLNNWFKNSAAGKTILVLVLVCMIFTSIFPSYVEAVGALGLGATVGGGVIAVGATAAAFGATIAATPLLIAGAVVGGIVAGIAWIWSPKDCKDWFSATCVAHLYTSIINVLIQIAGVTAVLMGQMFDTTLKLGLETYTIFAKNSVMTQLWGTIRDLVNLCFIFILLYAAVRTMLGLSTSPMKLVFNILIAALLVNFSFAITRTVIDASNVSTATFYNILTHDGTETVSKLILQAVSIDDLVNYDGINHLGGAPLSGGAPTENLGARALGVINSTFFSAGYATLCLLFIFAVNVLFIAFSIMLMIRTVVLILLILGSPVAFLAFAMPDSMHGLFKTWATYLLKQAFWLPIMLLLLVLGLIISAQLHNGLIEAMKIMAGKLNVATANQLLVLYIIGNTITMAFLLLPLIVAKSMGVAGADFAMKWGQKAMLFGGGVATGLVGMGARWAKIPEAVEKLPGGAYLRNLPRYGRDIISGTADSIGAASGLSSILPTSAAMKEPSISKRMGDYNKSLDAERKVEKKERLDAQKAKEVKTLEKTLAGLNNDFLSDDEINSKYGTDEGAKAEARARRADAIEKVGREMSGLGSAGRQSMWGNMKGNKAYLQGLTSDDLKKIREQEDLSDDDFRKVIATKATHDAKGAAGALTDEDLRTMNTWTGGGAAGETLRGNLVKNLAPDKIESMLGNMEIYGAFDASGNKVRDSKGVHQPDPLKQRGVVTKLKGSQLKKIDASIITPHVEQLSDGQILAIADRSEPELVTVRNPVLASRWKDMTEGITEPEKLYKDLLQEAKDMPATTPAELKMKEDRIDMANDKLRLYMYLKSSKRRENMGI